MKTALLLFAKEPKPGRVKTRLARRVGDASAVRIHRHLMETVCREISASGSTVVVCFDPPEGEQSLREWLGPRLPADTRWIPQAAGDLGTRLVSAFQWAFDAGFDAVAAVGGDCAEISPDLVSQAWTLLPHADCVIGPAEDGGYYLLGLKRPHPELFHEIPWSSPDTLAVTLERARTAGLAIETLPPLQDIDTLEDWTAVSGRVYHLRNMEVAQPISFVPLFMERVWGARRLEELYGKNLPPNARIGESWELVDREEAMSKVKDGIFAGRSLHDLWTNHRAEIFGKAPDGDRFPLLIKLLDCADVLSVQVHPPAAIAPELGGEPKTECWYVAFAEPGSYLYAGLKRGVTAADFRDRLEKGTVEECLHRIETKQGDAIFIPSGRVHAIGAGNVIVEVQQNSDTTYRVFDFNRVGLDGKPREMHVEQSMRSIQFDDPEPALAATDVERIIDSDLFQVDRWQITGPRQATEPGKCAIVTVLEGIVRCAGSEFSPGDLFLIPASAENATIEPEEDAALVLRTQFPG